MSTINWGSTRAYVALIFHVTPDGDSGVFAETLDRGPLRVLRTKMKQLGRESGQPFYLVAYKNRHPRAPSKRLTGHHFRCLAGRGQGSVRA